MLFNFVNFVSFTDPIHAGPALWSSTQGMRTIFLSFSTVWYLLAVCLYSPTNVTYVGTYAKWG